MIGWYVHHHGLGHLHRMQSVTAQLDEPVTVLSSLPRPADETRSWVQLARDDEQTGNKERDVTARGNLHWVPRGDVGLASRSAQIAEWIVRERPRLLVVDVSVEVSLLARLCGVPVVVMSLPGDRRDAPHVLARGVADALIAPWPPSLATTPDQHEAGRTTCVGAISRFDGRQATGARRQGTAYLLWGAGGQHDRDRLLDELRAATPDRQWIGSVMTHDPDEVWHHLCTAEVVVTHAGQNAVAEVAAARAPAVVIADARPFDEQECTVRRLVGLDVALPLREWPANADWPSLLSGAIARGGQDWARWNDGLGAGRAASLIASLPGASWEPS